MASSNVETRTEGDPIPITVAAAVSLWERAGVLYERHSWKGESAAVAACERLAADRKQFEPSLAKLLEHPNQLVVAYALFALNQMNSALVASLPPAVLQRRDKLTVQIGCYRTSTDLGGYARQLNKIAEARAGRID